MVSGNQRWGERKASPCRQGLVSCIQTIIRTLAFILNGMEARGGREVFEKNEMT